MKHSPLFVEKTSKNKKSFTSILSTVYLVYLSPMDVYFITDIRTNGRLLYYRHKNQKSIPEKNQLSMLEFQTAIAHDLQSTGKLASATRPSCERLSFNTTVKKPLKKHRTPTVSDLSNNTRFDKLNHFPVFQGKQQRCRKRRTGYPFIKCQKCRVALCLQKVRNCFTNYHTER